MAKQTQSFVLAQRGPILGVPAVLLHSGCCRVGVASSAELGVLKALGQFLMAEDSLALSRFLKAVPKRQLFQNRLEL